MLKLSILYEKIGRKSKEGRFAEGKRLFGWSKEAL